MPRFQGYETIAEIARHGSLTEWSARATKGESGGAAAPSIRMLVLTADAFFGDDTVFAREADHLQSAAERQRRLAEVPGSCWAPVLAGGRDRAGAYVVFSAPGESAQTLIDRRRDFTFEELRLVFKRVLAGLRQAPGGHGSLTAAHVFVTMNEDGAAAAAVLTRPQPDSALRPAGAREDMVCVGRILHEMVTHRPPPRNGAVEAGGGWARLGAGGERLRTLCQRLLIAASGDGAISLDEAEAILDATLPPRLNRKILAIAAVVLIGLGAVPVVGWKLGWFNGSSERQLKPSEMIDAADAIAKEFGGSPEEQYRGIVGGELTPEFRASFVFDFAGHTTGFEDSRTMIAEQASKFRDSVRNEEATAATSKSPMNAEGFQAEYKAIGQTVEEWKWQLGDHKWRVAQMTDTKTARDDSRKALERARERFALGEGATTADDGWLDEKLNEVKRGPDRPAKDAGSPKQRPEQPGDQARQDAWSRLGDSVRESVKTRTQTEITSLRNANYQRAAEYLQQEAARKVFDDQPLTDARAAEIEAIKQKTGMAEGKTDGLRFQDVQVAMKIVDDWLGEIAKRFPRFDLPEGWPRDGSESALAPIEHARLKAIAATIVATQLDARAVALGGEPSPNLAGEGLDGIVAASRPSLDALVRAAREGAAVVARMSDMLARGFTLDDRENLDGAASLNELGRQLDKDPYATLGLGTRAQKLLEGLRAAELLDPERLIQRVNEPQAALAVRIACWNKLAGHAAWPSTIAELREFHELGGRLPDLIPERSSTGREVHRRAEILAAVRPREQAMWRRLASALGPISGNAAPNPLTDLFALADAVGMDLNAPDVPASVRINRWRTELEQQARLQRIETKPVAERGPAYTKLLNQTSAPDLATGAPELDRVIQPFRAGRVRDLTKEGPGKGGWAKDEFADGAWVSYTLQDADPITLRFARLGEGTDETSPYIQTSEMTIETASRLLRLVRRQNGNKDPADVAGMLSKGQADAQGTGIWAWVADDGPQLIGRNRPKPSRPKLVDAGGQGNSGGWTNSWLSSKLANGAHVMPYPGEPPPAPEDATPIQQVSPGAVFWIARAISCRVPTAAEWADAARAWPTAEPNLRDAAWQTQAGYYQANVAAAPNLPSPWVGVFLPDAKFENDRAQVINGNDQVLWFRPVPAQSGPAPWPVVDLIGNLAELVSNDPTLFDSPRLQRDDVEKFSVIGGSALSGSWWKDGGATGFATPYPLLKAQKHTIQSTFSDVGFRLAFTARNGAGDLLQELAKVDYLPMKFVEKP